MDFELMIRVGDKTFGGTVRVVDWDEVDKERATEALKSIMDKTYNTAVEKAAKEAISV